MKKDRKCESDALTLSQMTLIGKAVCEEADPPSWARRERKERIPIPPSLSDLTF